MKHGLDVESADRLMKSRPLHLEAHFNHKDCVETLKLTTLQSMPEAKMAKQCFKGNVDVINTLPSCKECDIAATDNLGRAALHAACAGGHVSSIHELVKHGFDVETADSERMSRPLHLAAHFNHKIVPKP